MYTLHKSDPYSELFWSLFSHIRTEYGDIRSIFPYSVRMRENTDQNISEYGHFSRSVWENTDQNNSEYGHFSRSVWVRENPYSGMFYAVLLRIGL